MNEPVLLAGYGVLLAAAIALELTARRRGSATSTDVVDAVLRRPPGRLVLLAAWLWLGWHLFVRVEH